MDVSVSIAGNQCEVICKAVAVDRTGVEMEAMVGASVAALSVYDMVKGVSHEVTIGEVKLLEKVGGKRIVKDGKNIT